jgi:hypothetical protein
MSRIFLALLLCGSACTALPPTWRRPDSCLELLRAPAEPRPSAPSPTRNVILVTIDGARWQELFVGSDPELARANDLAPREARVALPNIWRHLIEGGVAIGAPGHGAAMYASGPEFSSLPGYQELLSGRPASECLSNRCPQIAIPTLLDRVRDALALPPAAVAAISSWERMERATSVDNHRVVVSAGRRHGVTREALRVNECASSILDFEGGPAPGHVDYRADRYTARLALEYLRARRPRVLFVGLGDTDEYGHAGDYPWYLDAYGQLDLFIGELFRTLDRMGAYGAATTVVLTTDHGWAEDFSGHGGEEPASARVWLLAAGGSVPRSGRVAAAREYHLADVTPTLLTLLGVPAAAGDRAPIVELLPREAR